MRTNTRIHWPGWIGQSHREIKIVVGTVLAILITVAAIFVGVTVLHRNEPKYFVATATVAVQGTSCEDLQMSGFRVGQERPGPKVYISDREGNVLAQGWLRQMTGRGSNPCLLEFEVAKVPAGRDMYVVTLGHAPQGGYTQFELENGQVHLSAEIDVGP